MKRIWIVFLALASYGLSNAQNLMPNPSYELATGCVTGNGWASVNSWRVPTSHSGSPDRFHVCAPGTFGVTANVFGDQAARTGSAYIGYVSHFGSNGLFREYIQAPLTSALIPGQTYTASGYFSLSDGSGWATDGYGFHFSLGAITGTGGSGPLPFTPQVSCATNTFMNDKIGWQLLSGNFVATAAFQYVTIGNYKSDAATNIQVQASGWTWNYTYMDDVSLVPAVVLTAEMGDFSGEMLETSAELVWDTRSEQGTQEFVVERSVGDVHHFQVVGKVAANGSPNGPAQYRFSDAGASQSQLNYYRIQEVDQNGAGGYSSTIELHSVTMPNEFKASVYPNPVATGQDLVLSLYSTKAEPLKVELIDLNGRLVYESDFEGNIGESIQSLSIGAQPTGWYVLRITGAGVHMTQKLMVVATEN
jgi:hypothetical protein